MVFSMMMVCSLPMVLQIQTVSPSVELDIFSCCLPVNVGCYPMVKCCCPPVMGKVCTQSLPSMLVCSLLFCS